MKKLTLVALVLVFSGAAVAASQGRYSDIDANKDGIIDKTEASAYSVLSDKWRELDANGDGVLDQTEFDKFEAISQ